MGVQIQLTIQPQYYLKLSWVDRASKSSYRNSGACTVGQMVTSGPCHPVSQKVVLDQDPRITLGERLPSPSPDLSPSIPAPAELMKQGCFR